jgi:cation transport ATPase
VVDKTGTLTDGRPRLVSVVAAGGYSRRRGPARGREHRACERASGYRLRAGGWPWRATA